MPWLTESELRADSQDTLAGFVWADLTRAFTLLDVARVEHESEVGRGAVRKARAVLDTVRRFLTRIEREEVSQRIRARVNELEAALAEFGSEHQAAA